MNCKDIEKLIPGYALGALESGERLEVEEHLETCSNCSRILSEHLDATAVLAGSVPQVEPSSSLRQRVLEHISHQPEGATISPVSNIPLVGKARQTSRIYRAGLPMAAALAIVISGLLAVLVFQLRGDLGEMRDENESLNTLVAVMQGENESLTVLVTEVADIRDENQRLQAMVLDQRSLVYNLALPGMEVKLMANSTVSPNTQGMLVASPDGRWGYIIIQGLQSPNEGMSYQIWLLGSNGPASVGVFSVDSTGYAQPFVLFPQHLDLYSSIAITMEPKQGSPWPSGTQILNARLR
ncbi:MAG: anti-sigma factor [Chloroflexi bacterium]|nr:anti-sigma factor [Chloroflexota bacterium]